MARDVRIGVAGYGLVGRRHAAAARACDGVVLAGIADADAAARDAARGAGIAVHETLEGMLAAGIDAVVLATPNAAHVEQGLACVAAGVPALVEKPLATDAGEGTRLVAAAARAGVPLLTGHHRRHDPRVAAARAAIGSGRIGAVRAVQATCWLAKPDAYFAAAPWRTRAGAGPGAVNMIHELDLMRHLVGEVREVRAVAVPSRRGHEPEDLVAAILSFASGAVGTISVSDAVAAPWSWELTAGENPAYPSTDQSSLLIGGSDASLSLPDLRVWRHSGTPDWMSEIGATSLLREPGDPLVRQMANLADVVRGRAGPVCSGAEGLRTLRVLEAVQASARSGGAVPVESD